MLRVWSNAGQFHWPSCSVDWYKVNKTWRNLLDRFCADRDLCYLRIYSPVRAGSISDGTF
jgi:hypothetical protein